MIFLLGGNILFLYLIHVTAQMSTIIFGLWNWHNCNLQT